MPYETFNDMILKIRAKTVLYDSFLMKHEIRKNTMLLLTNCEVHTGKYSDRSLDVRKTKVRIFSRMDRTNWSIRALLYSRKQHQ